MEKFTKCLIEVIDYDNFLKKMREYRLIVQKYFPLKFTKDNIVKIDDKNSPCDTVKIVDIDVNKIDGTVVIVGRISFDSEERFPGRVCQIFARSY